MGAALPKQYLPLAGRAVIDHAVERLLEHPRLDGVVVALGPADCRWTETEFAGHPDVATVTGGAERQESVLNALDWLAGRAAPDDWVLVHDAARPCVRRADITRLVDSIQGHAVGGLLGVPVRDTMKRTDTAARILETVPREHLWHAYTPQMFRLEMLREALRRIVQDGAAVTDEAGAMEHAGYRPLMIEGHPDNIKITRPADLELAEFYLRRQAEEAIPTGV
jgi:2-C-methyl-D-erythritol 4-phosphate cytidylyltransferase